MSNYFKEQRQAEVGPTEVLVRIFKKLSREEQADILPVLATTIEKYKLCTRAYPSFVRKQLNPMLKKIRSSKKELFNSLSEAKKQVKLDKRAADNKTRRDVQSVIAAKRAKMQGN